MHLHTVKCITIVCDQAALTPVTALLRELELRHSIRYDPVSPAWEDAPTGPSHSRIEIVTSATSASVLLQRIHDEIMSAFSLYLYESNARVIRKEEFD